MLASTQKPQPAPKLTGWAQAAVKNMPKSANQPVAASTSLAASAATTPASAPAAKQNKPSKANGSNSSSVSVNSDKKNKKNPSQPRQPYNRDEVKEAMAKLFETYRSQKNITLHENLISEASTSRSDSNEASLSWDTVSSNKTKNKKYACLADVAKNLRS